jgi:anti-sigma B factor antagonist
MELATDELAQEVTRVRLVGSFDIAGAESVDLMMNVLAGSRRKLLFDMTEVSFLASMGIRSLLTVAKAVVRRGGKVVLLKPNATVMKVLVTTGTDHLLPVRETLADALALLAD